MIQSLSVWEEERLQEKPRLGWWMEETSMSLCTLWYDSEIWFVLCLGWRVVGTWNCVSFWTSAQVASVLCQHQQVLFLSRLFLFSFLMMFVPIVALRLFVLRDIFFPTDWFCVQGLRFLEIHIWLKHKIDFSFEDTIY